MFSGVFIVTDLNRTKPHPLLSIDPRCKRGDKSLAMSVIEGLWKDSSERQAILDAMTPSEIKRRRYDK